MYGLFVNMIPVKFTCTEIGCLSISVFLFFVCFYFYYAGNIV